MDLGSTDRLSSGVDRAFGAWAAGPQRPTLGPGELHVWRADLRSVQDAVARALGEDERRRAADIGEDRARALWARSRGVLRALLGRYLQVQPDSFEIRIDARGKPLPVTLPGGRQGPHFNLSHSAHLALFGFATDAPLGVDVQFARTSSARPAREHLALARRHFGEADAARLERLEPSLREREFVRLWARHEAELKRLGTGIGGRLADVAHGRDEEDAGEKDRGEDGRGEGAEPWVAELDADPDAGAAAACGRAPRLMRLWDWGEPAGPA